MREGAVGFRHPVRVFALLDSVAAAVGSVHKLCRQTVDHRLVVAGASRLMIQRMASAWRRSMRTSTGT